MFGMFYMYVRQKFISYETKFQSMFDIIQSMALELKNRRDESESDSDSDDSSDVYEKKVINLSQMDSPFDFSVHLRNEVLQVESNIPLEVMPEPDVVQIVEPAVLELDVVQLDVVQLDVVELVEPSVDVVELVESSVDVDDMSTKSISTDLYDGLSVKELKERVSILGGPPLKTRKALMDFLKSKL
jgi:hypothetical protein